MATYYNKVLEAVDNAVYAVNPAAYLGIYKTLGYHPIKVKDPWMTNFIHYNALKQQVNTRVSRDEPMWADGQSIPEPGLFPLNFFSWSVTVTTPQFNSIRDDPTGMTAKLVRNTIERQQEAYAKNVDLWMLGYLSLAGRAESADWNGAFKSQATVGTIRSPEDCNTVVGTPNALGAINWTGAGQTLMAIENSIGVGENLFFQQYDTTTEASMYKGNGKDTFDIYAHPAVWQQIKGKYPLSAAATYDTSRDLLAMIDGYGTRHSTMAVDAGYTGVADVTAEVVISMNTKENFLACESIPYTVTEWQKKDGANNKGSIYRKMGYMKGGIYIKPYWINSLWKKACNSMVVTPNGA